MSLFGLIKEGNEQVLTVYKADISDHKAGIKQLEGAEKELAAVELEHLEARAKGSEATISNLGKIAFAALAAKEVFEVVWDGYKDGLKDTRLANAAATVDMEKLSEAARGLVKENDLLAFAAKASRAAFFNSQTDLQYAERAMYALEQQGRGNVEVTDAITNAMVSLKVKGLTDMGIYVDTTKVKFDEAGNVVDNYNNRLELHKRIIEAIKGKADEVAESQEGIGDSMQRTIVAIEDSWDDFKKGLGQLVVAFAPVIDALAAVVKLTGQIAGGLSSDIDWQGMVEKQSGGKIKASSYRSSSPMDFFHAANAAASAVEGINNVQGDLFVKGGRDLALSFLGEIGDYFAKPGTKKKGPKEKSDNEKEYHSGAWGLNGKFDARLGVAANTNTSLYENDGINDDDFFGKLATRDTLRAQEEATRGDRYEAFNAKKSESKLEKIFGPLSDFDAYHEAFTALTGATTAALGAWIDGSMSAGAAFKRFIGDALKGLASQMLVEGLKHGAYALGSIAFGDLGGAARHGAAAAAFGVGAAAAALAAHELGGSAATANAGGGSSTSPGAPQTYAPQAANNNTQRPNLFVIGDAFADDSIRARQLKAQKYFGLAMGATGTENG